MKMASIATLTFALLALGCAPQGSPHIPTEPYSGPPADIELILQDVILASDLICKGCALKPLPTKAVAIAAVTTRWGGRLLYNREALQDIAAEFGKDAAFGVLAHEEGHVITLITNGNAPELDADTYAGCMIAIAGRSPAPFGELLKQRNVKGGRYPSTEKRLDAVAEGYLECMRLVWSNPSFAEVTP